MRTEIVQFLANLLVPSGLSSTASSSLDRLLCLSCLSLASPQSSSRPSSLSLAGSLVWAPWVSCRCCELLSWMIYRTVKLTLPFRIGAAILSHRVDTFTLVSAFFVFSVGCLNVLLGLIFRSGAKTKRSVTSWREHAKSALPTHIGPVDVRPVASAASNYMAQKGYSVPFTTPGTFVASLSTGSTAVSAADDQKSAGYGFGSYGEKAAAVGGYLLSRPVESLPKYAARTPSSASSNSK